MAMVTRDVCRAIPGRFAIASAEVTTPCAMSPGPPVLPLARMKLVSPAAMRLPPYMVFWAAMVTVRSRAPSTRALIA